MHARKVSARYRAKNPPRRSGHGQLATCAVLALLCLVAAAHAGATTEPTRFNLCFDYGCKSSAEIHLHAEDWDSLEALFAAAYDPPSERRLIAAAVAMLERVSAAQTGLGADLGGNYAGAGQAGQMDCIDESTNTTAYLSLLSGRQMLRWHRVDLLARRAPYWFDQHWTAVIRDLSDGRRYAVDSWFLDNGARPYLQALPDWLEKQRLPRHPDLTDAGESDVR